MHTRPTSLSYVILIIWLSEWEDAVQDVAETLGLEIDALGLAPMPRADYITLPVPSTSKIDFVPSASGDIPPPPPPLEEEKQEEEAEVEPATTGTKRKTRGSAAGAKGKGKKGKAAAAVDEEPASKAARTNEGNQSAGGVGKIFTVLKEEHYKMPELPSAADLEAFLVAKQKEELLKEYV